MPNWFRHLDRSLTIQILNQVQDDACVIVGSKHVKVGGRSEEGKRKVG